MSNASRPVWAIFVLLLLVGCQAESPAPPPRTTVPSPVPAHCVYHGQLPDPACTPGVINQNVIQANIQDTICRPGYSATVRPPVSVTEPMKRRSMVEYGVQAQPASGYEYDHLISLELGGAPQDPQNLWPEEIGSARGKDSVENAAHRAVCSGAISLADAQQSIARDWVAFGLRLGVRQ